MFMVLMGCAPAGKMMEKPAKTTALPHVTSLKPKQESCPGDGRKPVWSDEFNSRGLPDVRSWSYNVGGHGWGNQEKQYYTEADTLNAVVRDGMLAIIARNDGKGDKKYTSARLVTKGKQEWKYGRMEMRAKLPAGVGLWPAFWMLGADIDSAGWPACGEIDIMEHLGYKPDVVLGTVHTAAYNHIKGTHVGKEIHIKNPYDSFHVFAIEWTEKQIEFFLDDTLYFSFRNEYKTKAEWPFDSPFFIILNLAVGGNPGGIKGLDESAFPAVFLIDYVRVYQKEENR